MNNPVPLRLTAKPETAAQRIQHLQAEARSLATAEITRLIAATRQLAAGAAEIAGGGEAYPAGIREAASRMADDLHARADNLTSLAGRVR